MNQLLQQRALARERVQSVTQKFATGPDSPIDSSIHPAFQLPQRLIQSSTSDEVKVADTYAVIHVDSFKKQVYTFHP